nr:proline-rich protein 15 [Anolis sagrei ordinatus]
MAEGARTAASPPGPGARGGGGSSGSSGTWWKSLTSRKKTKEALSTAASGSSWPPSSEVSEAPPPCPPSPSEAREGQQPGVGSGSRRNLKISRSGRFKEKRKVRAALLAESPQKLFEGEGNSAAANNNSGEAPCQ